MRLDSIEEINAYFEGKIDGVALYAWWKDGTQYVGTSGRTLLEAKGKLILQREDTLKAFSEGKEIWAR